MKNLVRKAISIVIVAVIVAMSASLAFAAAVTLDFTTSEDADYFQTITDGTGGWEVTGGKLEFTQVRGDPAMSSSWWNVMQFLPRVDDFTLELDLMQKDNDYLMITFGTAQSLLRHESQKGYGIRFLNDAVNPGQRGAVLSKTTLGSAGYTEIKRAPQSVSGYYVNTIKIVKTGTSLKLYIKNEDTDLDPDNKYPPNDGVSVLLDVEIEDLDGYIQFFSGNGRCTIDNLTITAEGADFSLPGDPTATPAPTKAATATPAPTTATASGISSIASSEASSASSVTESGADELSTPSSEETASSQDAASEPESESDASEGSEESGADMQGPEQGITMDHRRSRGSCFRRPRHCGFPYLQEETLIRL
jgi:hypothetical protein